MIPLWRRRQLRPPLASKAPGASAATLSLPDELHQALGQLRTKLRGIASDKTIWLASFTALGTAEVAMLSARPSGVVNVLRGLGLAGAGGLVFTAGKDLRATRDTASRLDAANDLAWGLQGIAGLSLPAWAEAQALSLGLGVVGAALQTGSGLIRIGQGIRRGDGASIKLGALDLGGGLLWMGWDLVGLQQPLYVGSYVVLMIAREAYANRQDLPGLMGKLRGQARQLGSQAEALIGEAYDDLRFALLR